MRRLVALSGGWVAACDSAPVPLVPEVARTEPRPAQLVRLPIDAAASPVKIAEAASAATHGHGLIRDDAVASREPRRRAGRDRGGGKLMRSELASGSKGSAPQAVAATSKTSEAAALLAMQALAEEVFARDEADANSTVALDARSECDWSAAAVTEDHRCSEELWSTLRGTRDEAQLRCEEDLNCRGLMFYNNRGGDGRTVARGFYQGCGGDVGTVVDASWDSIVRPTGCTVADIAPAAEEPDADATGEVATEPPAAVPPPPPPAPPPPPPQPPPPEQDNEPNPEDDDADDVSASTQCSPTSDMGEQAVAEYLDCLMSSCEDSAACRRSVLQEASCGHTLTDITGLERFTGGQRMQKEALCPSECELCSISVSRGDTVSAGDAPEESSAGAGAVPANATEPLIPLVKDQGRRLLPGAAAAIAAAAAVLAF